MVQGAVTAALSTLRDDTERYRRWLRSTLHVVSALSLGALALLSASTPTLIVLVLGEQWAESAPLLRILAVSAVFMIPTAATKWIYIVEGRADRQRTWALLTLPVIIASTVVGASWGVRGVALGWGAASAITAIAGVRYCLNHSTVESIDIWNPFGRSALAAVC